MTVTEHLEGFPVTYETPVAWGEMDAFQHVNNSVYFRYFESARLALFVQVGIDEHVKKTGEGPILAFTSCRFRKPLEYPDRVTVGTKIIDIGDDRFTMLYRVVSHELGAVAADGEGRIVFYDYRNACKVSLPADLRSRLEAL